jgi:hypothetical protein
MYKQFTENRIESVLSFNRAVAYTPVVGNK